MMYLVEVFLFWTYHNIHSLPLLFVATFVVVMCYGGAYGITPAFAADYFGPRDVGSIFGLMMVPWAFAAVFGPLLFAYLRQMNGNYDAGPLPDCGRDDRSAHSSDSDSSAAGQETAADEDPTGAALEAEAEAISPE